MRVALGQPLQNISENILNRVISKSIQADLKKYKMGNKKPGTTNRERTRSPVSRKALFQPDDYEGAPDANYGDVSKEVSHYLSQLSTSSGNKMSLIKMQVIKCDENSAHFKKMRQCFNHGDIDEADRILAQLEESNHQSLLDLQNEIADGLSVAQTIGFLCEQLKKEKIENHQTRGRSRGGGQSPAYNTYENARNRSTSANRRVAQAQPDYSKYDSQIAQLRKNLSGLEEENEQLRNTMREMVDDYTKQLELRDETIHRLEMAPQPKSAIQLENQLRQEVEDLSFENRRLKD